MNPDQLFKSIYLGDRACQRILIEGATQRVALQIDCISRLRPGATTWDFHNDENLDNGWIVFTGVAACTFDPPGPLPGDWIEPLAVEPIDDGEWLVKLSLGADQSNRELVEVTATIRCTGVHLEDPHNRPYTET